LNELIIILTASSLKDTLFFRPEVFGLVPVDRAPPVALFIVSLEDLDRLGDLLDADSDELDE